MDDLLRRVFQRFGRPSAPDVRITDVHAFDERISSVEHKQGEIEARLRLLERQADPRDHRHEGDHGGR